MKNICFFINDKEDILNTTSLLSYLKIKKDIYELYNIYFASDNVKTEERLRLFGYNMDKDIEYDLVIFFDHTSDSIKYKKSLNIQKYLYQNLDIYNSIRANYYLTISSQYSELLKTEYRKRNVNILGLPKLDKYKDYKLYKNECAGVLISNAEMWDDSLFKINKWTGLNIFLLGNDGDFYSMVGMSPRIYKNYVQFLKGSNYIICDNSRTVIEMIALGKTAILISEFEEDKKYFKDTYNITSCSFNELLNVIENNKFERVNNKNSFTKIDNVGMSSMFFWDYMYNILYL